ncbi:DUF4952 domain-containing protein [Agrobacterium tumefaciens]|nr:DUF4952 domain-containing protein [Agrobacterium tumefaciens]NSZ09739.1 DUF4952 domain-containing protein [Agrobacterium tumefaciens]
MAYLVIAPPAASPVSAGMPMLKAQDCGDFLAKTHKTPANVNYVECRYLPDRQGKPLQATYSVSGKDAADAEAHLIKSVGLGKLRRVCCQWESKPARFKDRAGADYTISMYSGETMISSRTDWHDIPRFEILVETFTEEI